MDIRKTIKHNPMLISTRKRAQAFFADVFFDDRAMINVMMDAWDVHIIDELSDPSSFSKNRIVSNIVSKYAVREDMAIKAVETWASILSPEAISILKQHESDEKAAEDARRLELFNEPEVDEELNEYTDLESIKDDYESYYVNPIKPSEESGIYIPCGFGNTDNGFFIHGIKTQPMCNHSQGFLYALIYNFMVRNSKMTENDVPDIVAEQSSLFSVDYRSVYRLSIIILQLIKNNYVSGNSINLDFDGESVVLKCSVDLINDYSDMFCKIIGIPTVVLSVNHDAKGIRVSLNNESGIYAKNNTKVSSNARDIWYGRKINYNIDVDKEETRSALTRLLTEISPFSSFKEGQLTALASMLNSKKHAVCIMPTGSGKSLIYYLASILQPIPIFVVSPTDILIRDQIRNLRKFHRIDNVAHLQLTDQNSFKFYCMQCNINFLTPMTLQNINLMSSFRHINIGEELVWVNRGDVQVEYEQKSYSPLAAYIVLDEIHCLSNWGHDFRPEYLMLSKTLNKRLDQISLWGFTATANYTVVDDIQKQLGIPQENIYSPISFDKYNITYDFNCVESTDAMYDVLRIKSSQFVSKGERTLVFVKTEEIADKVAEIIGFEADVFHSYNPESYYQFVEGKCCVLVTTEELGIGINLPNIKNIVNFGLPLSKDLFVQELGRAGRENGDVNSIVIYLDPNENNVPLALLRRDSSVSELLDASSTLNNDYSDILHSITNNCPTEDAMSNKLIGFYQALKNTGKNILTDEYELAKVDDAKQLLYMLYVCGYVNDWYAYSSLDGGKTISIAIDISSSYGIALDVEIKILSRMRSRIKDYFEMIGDSREMIVKTDRAQTHEEIISLYVGWYYTRFLYLHKEQFIDFFEFIQRNSKCETIAIAEEIQDYFTLPFVKIKLEEATYADMPLGEIGNKGLSGVNRTIMADLERINSNHYSRKYDLLLFCGHLRMDSQFDESRLMRIMSNISDEEKADVASVIVDAYAVGSVPIRLKLLKFIGNNGSLVDCSLERYLGQVYSKIDKDAVYYGIMAHRLNKAFV